MTLFKTSYKIGLITGILLAFITSCKKDVLDQNSQGQLSSDLFWQTESDANSGLAACYAFLKSGGDWYGTTVYYPAGWDALSDDAYTQYDYGSANSTSFNGPTPNSGGYVRGVYTVNYRAIAALNIFFANIDRPVMDETNRAKLKAEAHFLRAFYYFQLASLYGNVILVDKPLTDSYKEPRAKSTKADVLKFVNAELDQAITGLPDVAYTDGHVVKGTAQSLKAKVLLYDKKYTEAAAAAKQIIDGGKFSLSSSYKGLFYKPDQTNNPEVMFSVMNLPPNSYPDPGVDLFGGVWQSTQPTQNLVSEYDCSDGLPTTSSPLYDATKPYDNRDPRLRMSIYVPGDGAAQGWNLYDGKTSFVPFSGVNTTGFNLKKGLDPAVSNPSYSTQSKQDYVLMRYAEVLLNYAEAVNEASGPTAEVYTAINAVRNRADVKMPPLATGLSQSDMREKIRHERRVEFALEGQRYYDLRRWGIAVQKINGFAIVPGNNNLNKKIYRANYDLWPLPQFDIDTNPALVQNPGY